ncbi:MAG: tRNA-dihydrouridine synthase family protein [Clostridiales bacterium]|nr:tRNA-dihydrouridine synthase family protein [Clostridiales bacterium]
MQLYFAPLEGITDAIFRRVHHDTFSGVSKYFLPFVSPSESLSYTIRQEAEISPALNAGLPAIPQILAKKADYFLGMAKVFADNGYPEVNLNLGCPSGTATGKGKGAGMLKNPDELCRFLDDIYAKAPLPISIKTRIGFDSVDEWPRLREVFSVYPIHELIIHPRTRNEQYGGTAHRDLPLSFSAFPYVYNGDIFTVADYQEISALFPGASAVMIGRGAIANPALFQEISGGTPLTLDLLALFHDRLCAAYLKSWPQSAAIGRMHAIMRYMFMCFDAPERYRKEIGKTANLDAYSDAVSRLFHECPFKETPSFVPNRP